MTMSGIIIHDLPSEKAEDLFIELNDFEIINAKRPFAKCLGCFGCWLRTPGECVFKDDIRLVGSKVLTSEAIYIITEGIYGGYSPAIKRVWDRCIPGVLPFFKKKHQELHHTARYANSPYLNVCFYNAGQMSAEEKITAESIVKGNALNFMADHYRCIFINEIEELKKENWL